MAKGEALMGSAIRGLASEVIESLEGATDMVRDVAKSLLAIASENVDPEARALLKIAAKKHMKAADALERATEAQKNLLNTIGVLVHLMEILRDMAKREEAKA